MSFELSIIGDGLSARYWRLTDAGDHFRLVDKKHNRPWLEEYRDWGHKVTSADYSYTFIQGVLPDLTSGAEYRYAIFYEGKLVGAVNLFDSKGVQVELGFWFDRKLAPELAVKAIQWALKQHTEFGIVYFKFFDDDASSRRIVRHIGFTELRSTLVDEDNPLGRREDTYTYALRTTVLPSKASGNAEDAARVDDPEGQENSSA